jgi:ABC-2 type transport system ATP-binding protein
LFDGVDRKQLSALGDVRTPNVANLFIAMLGERATQAPEQTSGQKQGAAQ